MGDFIMTTVTIGSTTFEAEPYFLNEKTIPQGTDPTALDPYNPDFPFATGRRRSITAVDYRLIQNARRKIYEYNCQTKRGDSFDLGKNDELRIAPVILYVVQERSYAGAKQHPNRRLRLKKTRELAKAFRAKVGLPARPGMSDPNQDVDAALVKLGGANPISGKWMKAAKKLIPDASFVIQVDIEFAYFRLKFDVGDEEAYVLIGIPRGVRPVRTITYVCRQTNEDVLLKVGEERKKKAIPVGLPEGFEKAVELRKAYDDALAEKAEAERREREKTEREKLEAEKEMIERSQEWNKKRLEEIEEKLTEGD